MSATGRAFDEVTDYCDCSPDPTIWDREVCTNCGRVWGYDDLHVPRESFRMVREARDLLGDYEHGSNPEYVRGLVELIVRSSLWEHEDPDFARSIVYAALGVDEDRDYKRKGNN